MDFIKDKNNRAGLIGTIIFHSLLLLLLLFVGLTYPDPLPDRNDGITINFGNSEEGMGEKETQELNSSSSSQNTSTNASENNAITKSENNIATQNNTETVAVNSNPSNTKTKDTPKTTQPKVSDNLSNALNALNSSNNSNEGETGHTGNQGDLNGDPNSHNHVGGGTGNGVTFSLGGRSLVSFKKPDNPTQEDGSVVVDIVVNKNGTVIKAIPGARGSTTTNPILFKKAKEAALKAKFDTNLNAATEQKGQITFVFILN